MRLVLFLLCSIFFHFTFASNRLRLFYFNGSTDSTDSTDCKDSTDSTDSTDSKVNHCVALRACTKIGASLVTVYDEEDIQFIGKSNFSQDDSIWLGLKQHKEQNITWSDGVLVSFNKSSVNITNGDQICEAIDGDTWKGFSCSDTKPFMCYQGNNYTLIKEEKNWCQALQYCRKNFFDLASISNTSQHDEVIKEGKNESFWIGLLHDEWEWKDGGCSTFRKWGLINDNEQRCTAYTSGRNDSLYRLYRFGCGSQAYLFCSKGHVRIRVIQVNATWEEALDYCSKNHTRLLCIESKEDQMAVEQWLNKTVAEGPFWIGLRQSHVFGFWIWSDRIVHYSNWKNDTQPELPFSNSCGVIHKDDYRWSDENCWTPRYFLCEEEIIYMEKNKTLHA